MLLQVSYPGRADYLFDWTENLSSGGLFVRTDEQFQVGDEVRLAISFPSLLEPIEIAGCVAWERVPEGDTPRGIGVKAVTDVGRGRLAELALLASQNQEVEARNRFRLLLAEDSKPVLEALRMAMERSRPVAATVDVQTADDGEHALTLIKRSDFDLVVTDLYMPGLDGFKLIARIRQIERMSQVPILAITGGTGDEERLAHEAGASAFLRKPVAVGALIETIGHLLGQQRSRTRIVGGV